MFLVEEDVYLSSIWRASNDWFLETNFRGPFMAEVNELLELSALAVQQEELVAEVATG